MNLPNAMKNHSIPSIFKRIASALFLTLITNASMAQQEIQVENQVPAILVSGTATESFGTGTVASYTNVRTYTITNIGDADLTGVVITKSGTHQADFTVSALTPSGTTLAAAAAATFTITFDPSASGPRSAAINIASNDANENPFVINLTGEGTQDHDVAVTVASTYYADGASTYAFGDVPVAGPNGTATVTITNSGTLTNLAFVDPPGAPSNDYIQLSGTNASEFTVTQPSPTTDLTPGQSRTITVTCNPSTSGSKTATLTINTNAPGGKGVYTITLTAFGTTPPEIDVYNAFTGGSVVTTRSFGNVTLGQTSTRDFRIENTGTLSLTSSISIVGTDASYFTLAPTPVPLTTVPGGSSTTFSVVFAPTVLLGRDYDATIRIATNDSDENPYDISISGVGQAPNISVEAPVGSVVTTTAAASFGQVFVGGTGNLRFTIRNTGNLTLTFGSITTTGTGISVKSQPTSFSISPGGSTSFVLQFQPTAEGSYTGSVTIPGNNIPDIAFFNSPDDKTPNYVIPINGTSAVAPTNSDAFGYVISEQPPASDNTYIQSTDAGVYTATGFSNDDDFRLINIGFEFPFYDRIYTKCFVSTNGLITFDNGTTSYSPQNIPTTGGSADNFIAPFWTDLNMAAGGQILFATKGTAPNRVFVIKYENAPEFNNPTGLATFQVNLYEGTGAIEVQYKSVTGFSATRSIAAGIESRDYGLSNPQPGNGVVGLKYVFGQYSALTTPFENAAFTTPTAVRYTRPVIITVESKYQRPYFVRSIAGCGTTLNSKTITCLNTTGLVPDMDIYGASIPAGAKVVAVTPNVSFTINLNATLTGTNTLSAFVKYPYTTNCTPSVNSKVVACTDTDGMLASMEVSGTGIPEGAVIESVTPGVSFTMNLAATLPNPTVVTVSGKVNIGSESLGLNPRYGTFYKTPIGTLKRFEAPEFIYLDKDFVALASAGSVTDTNPAMYRLVNDGYAIDGQPVQGANTFFTVTLNRDVSVVWKWRIQYAATIESGKPNGGSVNEGGRQWMNPGDQFVARLDTPLDDLSTASGIRLKVIGYDLFDKASGRIGQPVPVTAGSYVESTPFSISQPVRLRWNWIGEVRYRFDATSGVTSDNQPGLAFIQYWSGYVPPVPGPAVAGTPISPIPTTQVALGKDHTIWIPIGSKITVGALYRSSDRRLTLTDFSVPPGGDLSLLGKFVSALDDQIVSISGVSPNPVARTKTLIALNPTDIHWVYGPTVFRAEVALGESFDPNDADAQLVPNLADGGNLRVEGAGPGTTYETKIFPPEGSLVNGLPLRWDALAQKFFPVQAGCYRVSWPDASNPGESYIIEIATNYPGETAKLTSDREEENGLRETYVVTPANPPTVPEDILAYVGPISPPMNPVSSEYPAYPAAHYRHIYDSIPGRRPPTKLDISNADEWAFQELPFADKNTAALAVKTSDGVPFTVTGNGRSVALFSQRPNRDEIATGDLTKETLVVRVVSSTALSPISRDDSRLVLGRRALQLGTSNLSNREYGIVGTGAPTIDPGDKFAVDFWLNTKDLKSSTPMSLTGCTTLTGSTTVTCASATGLVAGMGISGTNIPAGAKIASISGNTLTLTIPATADGTGLSLSATNKPVTVFSTGGGGLQVTLDPEGSTTTATYRGNKVTHILPKSGASWRHFALHAFTYSFFGIEITVFDFYLDGVREEIGFVSTANPGNASSTVSTGVDANSLRFGVDANSSSVLLMDNFRLFALTDALGYLQPAEVRLLRNKRNMMTSPLLRSVQPLVSFDFETAPASGQFASQGSQAGRAIGPVSGSGQYIGKWAYTDLQEVASRIECTLDNAAFRGTGYILNAVSNYNANLYSRANEIGQWGPVFPVNSSAQLFSDAAKRLEVAYYENLYLTDRSNNPNVAWPYIATAFNEVVYPTLGKDKDKAIYIASRIGSEGVDQKGYVQQVFDGATYADLQIYHQSNLANPGYNPNEEHALVAPGGRAALKVKNLGDDVPNSPPLAAFALQRDINTKSGVFSSDPWVLIQVNNLVSGEPEMAAYQVFKTRTGATAFPRPSTAVVNAPNSGLSYEAASNPEDGFLMIDADKAIDFSYQFEYPAMAGDLLIPPYPLNLVIGNVAMSDARGNSLQVNGINQRCLWRDVNKNAWVVSGNGKFFHQFFYPMRGDFYLSGTPAGTPVAWIPDGGTNYTGVGANLNPVKVLYNTFWRSDYPKLKRGETLTYQGGEYFNETPGAKGLPALVAMAASEIVYDSATPSMSYGAVTTNRHDISSASARLMRPLDRRENPFTVAQMGTAGFTPAASTKVLIIAERWYFKELPGSLQKRFYFDSLAEKLVFRGRLNEKESGDSNLTSGPDPLNILEPNVLTSDEYNRMRGISSDPAWQSAIDAIYLKCQNPDAVTGGNTNASLPARNLQGVKNTPANYPADLSTFWVKSGTNYSTTTSPAPSMVPLDSFGVGSALVPNPSLLTQAPNGSLYVTIAENNRSELSGAPVSLHIIEIVPDRYRGAIKVIEGSDAFSEKVTLQHNGEFGANTGDLYYEWWIRDAGPLDVVAEEVLANGTLKQTDTNGLTLWQEYIPAERADIADNNLKHLGMHTIVFEGRPDVVLADKLVLMRYRHKNETGWNLVPFEFANANTAWKPGNVSPVTPAPFQWAGAANSPQLQADGSKRYIPQLIMGWVKRVLDRINPYEARYNDFFSNESPATYSSQIQIAGGPYAGKVALNPDKNVIENTGLIELYRTVLDRARELSIDNASNGNASDGINQALLLAATRLSVLYELLANEAYSDAQDSTINSGEDSALVGIASYTHAFQNMEADLQHEELALLRGTDFGKSYPVYNRIFWNYAKGLGEAAYNVNYNIYDVTKDGFINEDDARKLYPQGHGDAWGHYVSSLDMHYILLQHPGFTWRTRAELYSLMQNVLEVDFLDEKTFSRLAAARARAGRDIVRNTYRLKYTQNPNGQWQGYTDGADPARAWGVSEWAHRAGQSAHFDWAVANALLPEEADAATPISNPENLDRIERSASVDDIGAISGGLHEIQVAMDEANKGVNPLGFDSDAMAFDIEIESSHFEQIYDRAVEAANNALATLEMATQSQNKLRSLADDTDSLIQEAMAQDLDFRNRLIEIFGRPYEGTIGVGKAYPEGYLGADTLLFAYLDKTKIDQIVPPKTGGTNVVTFDIVTNQVLGIMNKQSMVDLYNGAWNGSGSGRRQTAFKSLMDSDTYLFEPASGSTFTAPYTTASKYAFQTPADKSWGNRTSYGTTQAALNNMLAAEIELDTALNAYTKYIRDLQNNLHRIDSQLAIFQQKGNNHQKIVDARAAINAELIILNTIFNVAAAVGEAASAAANGIKDGLPTSIGFSNDVTSPARGIASAIDTVINFVIDNAEILKELNESIMGAILEAIEFSVEQDNEQLDQVAELEGMLADYQSMAGSEQEMRNAIGSAAQSMEVARQEYITAQATGFRILREREAFNKVLAAKVQKNRYQDMVFRLSRNEAMSKYQSAFNAAAQYAWLAARAYDYETSLDPGHPAAPGPVLDQIVKERQLGYWADGAPQVGRGGLAEILAQLKGNYNVLKGQLGINNPQSETDKISLRQELFRIHTLDPELTAALELQDSVTTLGINPVDLSISERLLLQTLSDPDNQAAIAQAPASNDRWKEALKARIVPDLNTMPEFKRYCRPFASGVQPGLAIRFSSTVEPGKNFFGHPLMAGDHIYSTANFATKVHSLGVWMDDYNAAGLSTSPRAYLIPLGDDYLRTSTSAQPLIRSWSLVEQRIPTPFVINQSTLSSPEYIPTLDGVDGSFGELRRYGDFRIYHNNGDPEADDSELIMDSRLTGRSVWNSQWMLVIPGAGLGVDPTESLDKLTDSISDIKLYFTTTSHQGQ